MQDEQTVGYLTTHVLDTASGSPAAGLQIELFRLEKVEKISLTKIVTNADGRVDGPILTGEDFKLGEYELIFHTAPYFEARDKPSFYRQVPVQFLISDPSAHYHVPLLISPFGYSTYRGS